MGGSTIKGEQSMLRIFLTAFFVFFATVPFAKPSKPVQKLPCFGTMTTSISTSGKPMENKPVGETTCSVANKPVEDKLVGECTGSVVDKPIENKPVADDCTWIVIQVPCFVSLSTGLVMCHVKYQVCGGQPPPQF